MLATLAPGGAGFEYLVLARSGDGQLAGAAALVRLLVAALGRDGLAGAALIAGGAGLQLGTQMLMMRMVLRRRGVPLPSAMIALRAWLSEWRWAWRLFGWQILLANMPSPMECLWIEGKQVRRPGARAGGRGTGARLFLQPWRVDRLAAQAQVARHCLHGHDAGARAWQPCRRHGGRSRQMRESHGPANRLCPSSGCAQHGRSGGAGLAQAA
jgi:hypothetical protein